MKNQTKGSLLLLLTTVIWGTTFVAQDTAMAFIGPYAFQFARSIVGCVVLLPVIFLFDRRKKKAPDYVAPTKADGKNLILGGAVCGFFLCVASCFQQVGTSTRPLRPHSQLPLILTPPTRGSVLALGSLRPRLTSSHIGTWTCPPAGWQAPHEVGTGSQLGQGPALPTSVPTVVNPATTEGPHSPQRDHPTAYSSDHQSEMCSWAP